MKSKTTAAVLAFFLGGIGLHRFYLNQTGLGIVYLIFCWTLIPVLIAFIDFIVFLVMSENSFNEKYNRNISFRASSQIGTADELEKLHILKEKGIITDSEFQSKKSRLL